MSAFVPELSTLYDNTNPNGYISGINSSDRFQALIVQTLPTSGISTSTIYMVLQTGQTNIYDEWMYISNAWTKIGTTSIDMSKYTKPKYIGGGGGGSLTVSKIQPSTWASIEPAVSIDYDKIFEQMAKRFSKVPTIEHKCHNCGGTLEIKENDGIFKCPYCKSCYAIGTSQINRRY